MKSIERLLTAIENRKPDKVPYMELLVDEGLGRRLLDRSTPIYKNPFIFDGFEEKGFDFIGRDYKRINNI